MKRFHVNVSVGDIAEGVRFYSALFATEPTVRKADYAKWMLDDPRINFAISQRGYPIGVNHLGFQVDTADELAAMRAQLTRADHALVEQSGAACCYANSDKYWVTDPTGVAWETFHTLDAIPIYGGDTEIAPKTGACCVPAAATVNEPCCERGPRSTAQASCAS
ncbi:MAG TPA: ArsI/CadI family heavy metal resistance metalloenzyme [Steroidobacteraceae bacterium]|nr:ArsI/CadI family heavy metal resistance metalloenzyme [Steroidobacteraceae bacterium]